MSSIRRDRFSHDQEFKRLISDEQTTLSVRQRPLPDRALRSKPGLGVVPNPSSSSSGSGGIFVIITLVVIVATVVKLFI